MDVRSNQFTEIDLSSLEEIRGGAVLWFNNLNLCYFGDITTYIVNNSLPSCIVLERRDIDQCCKFIIFE